MKIQEQTPQPAEDNRKPMGKARVKPRHLSQLVRQAIIDQFQVRQSSEDIAEELGIPVGTVRDVLLLHQLHGPATPGVGPMLVRRAVA